MIWSFILNNKFTRAIGALLATLGAGYAYGRLKQNQRQDNKRAKEYIETRKEIDDAEIYGDDPALAERWLRERQSNRDL